MRILERLQRVLERRSTSYGTSSPELAELLAGASSPTGLSIGPETAMRSPTFAAAARAIAETAGMLPVKVRRRDGTTITVLGAEHPAAKLLSGFANPWTECTTLRTQLTLDAILNRNGGFAKVIRLSGRPVELHRLPPGSTAPEWDQATGEPQYRYSRPSGGQEVLSWSDVLHVTMPGWAFDRQWSPLSLAHDAVALDILLATHQAKVFAKGGLPRIVLSPDGVVGPEAIKNAIAFFLKQASGEELGRPIVLPAAFKESFRSFGLKDMEFAELRQFATEQIARSMRMPPTVIGDLTKGTYANTEQQNRQFLQLCLLPWLEVWEAALTRVLIPPAERDSTEVEFVVEDLLRADTQTRFAAYREATGGAWLERNEARELEGRGPLPDGKGLLNQAGQQTQGTQPNA